MTSTPESVECAHVGCTCKLEAGRGVERDGYEYCDPGCAEGQGCEHEGCNCKGVAAAKTRGAEAPG